MKNLKNTIEKSKSATFDLPLSKSYRATFLPTVLCLKPVRCFVRQGAVRTPGIVKKSILINTFHELPFRFIILTVYFFFFHRREESLRNGVVMQPAGMGRRWDNLVQKQQLPKGARCILGALVAVKCQALRTISALKCPLKCRSNQICTVF